MGMECSLSVFRGCDAAASTSKRRPVEAIDGAAEIVVVDGEDEAARSVDCATRLSRNHSATRTTRLPRRKAGVHRPHRTSR